MNKRGTGSLFIAIAAFLISTKYLSLAIVLNVMVTVTLTDVVRLIEEYSEGFTVLSTASLIALVIGIIYIVWGEVEEIIGKRKDQI
ncbi:hypothetical protein V1503_05210 [Bacillus sp. SCS-151]|uniref:hypothetical protein n=1 Tax=Nanhaiella sioensis TaxID=3115293 RepID=UPI0039785264